MDKQCSICNKEFSFMKQNKSKCKRCNLIVCFECCKNEFKISSSVLKPLRKEKICLQCKNDCLYILQMIEQYKWNQNNELQLEIFQQTLTQDQYKQMFQDAKKDTTYKYNVEQIKGDIIKCFITQEIFNYSFQDWICYSINSIKYNQVFEDLETLLIIFLYKNKEIGYSTEILQVAIILLTLMNNLESLYILEQIYELMPYEYWPSSNQEPNVQKLVQDFQLAFRVDSTQVSQVKKFMEYFSTPNLQTLFIKGLTFSCFHVIFQEFIQQMNFEIIQKYLIVVAKCFLKECQILDYKTLGRQILTKTDYKSITQIKQLLDSKLGNSQLSFFSSPKASVLKKRNSVCSIDTSFDIVPPQLLSHQNSQRNIKMDENFIFNIQTEQSTQIVQLISLIEQKKKRITRTLNQKYCLKKLIKWKRN